MSYKNLKGYEEFNESDLIVFEKLKKEKEIQLSFVYLLWVLVGFLGFHRIYLGKIISGVIQGLTFVIGSILFFYVLFNFLVIFQVGLFDSDYFKNFNELLISSLTLLSINFIWIYIDAYLIVKIVRNKNNEIYKKIIIDITHKKCNNIKNGTV